MGARKAVARRVGLLLVVLASCGFLSGVAEAAQKPVTLTVLAPVSPTEFPLIIGKFLNTPTETSGGWPITIQLNADNGQLLGVGTEFNPPFPENGRRGFLLFNAGPDPCLGFVPVSVLSNFDECFGAQIDETFLEFTPGVYQPGVPALGGNPGQLVRLTDFGGGGRPTLFSQFSNDAGLQTEASPLGPVTGGGDTTQDVCLSDILFYTLSAPACNGGSCDPGSSCHTVPVND